MSSWLAAVGTVPLATLRVEENLFLMEGLPERYAVTLASTGIEYIQRIASHTGLFSLAARLPSYFPPAGPCAVTFCTRGGRGICVVPAIT